MNETRWFVWLTQQRQWHNQWCEFEARLLVCATNGRWGSVQETLTVFVIAFRNSSGTGIYFLYYSRKENFSFSISELWPYLSDADLCKLNWIYVNGLLFWWNDVYKICINKEHAESFKDFREHHPSVFRRWVGSTTGMFNHPEKLNTYSHTETLNTPHTHALHIDNI